MIHCNNSSSWSTLFWSVEHNHKDYVSNILRLQTLSDFIRWSAKIGRGARCSDDGFQHWSPRLAYGLGQYFQDLGHSFSPYGPPSRQITYMYQRLKVLRAGTHYLRHFLQSPSLTSKKQKCFWQIQWPPVLPFDPSEMMVWG